MKNNEYILSIGGSNIDIHGFSNKPILMRESNPGKMKLCAGGVGRNIVNNLANLGLKDIKFITHIGNDIFGDMLLNDIKSMGIDCSNIIKKDFSTFYMAIMNNKNDMELAISDMDALDKNLTVEYLNSIGNIIENAKLIISDAVISREVFEYLIKEFPNKKILCDAVSIKKSEHIKGLEQNIYALKLNSNEASFLLDKDINNIEDGKNAVKIFLEKGVEEVYITFGENGICYGTQETIKNKTNICHLEAPKVNIVNASGSGDAFMSGIAYSIFYDFDLDYKVKFASIMSMFALESEHTVNNEINLNSVKERLNKIFKIREDKL